MDPDACYTRRHNAANTMKDIGTFTTYLQFDYLSLRIVCFVQCKSSYNDGDDKG